MPTILWIHGLRVTIYPADHRPAHVHVIGRGCEAVFKLDCPFGPPELRENLGFSRKDLSTITSALADDLTPLCTAWSRLHGDF